MASKGPAATAILTLAIFLAAIAFGFAWTRTPRPQPTSVDPHAFSALRAAAHVGAIARAPHPFHSREHERVRVYIESELRALGLELLPAEDHHPDYSQSFKNILARLPGLERGPGVLLMAHYDSVSKGPGAADDASGVATLLETARALKTRPRLPRDVFFLITDAEELGLFGATAFVATNPVAKSSGVVVNFEARGSSGPAFLFRTSKENGALLRTAARSVPHLVANSLSGAIFRYLPNDTDLSVFEGPAIDFANIGGVEHYHAPTDTLEHLDLGTLQQKGDAALSLAIAFASSALPPPREPDAEYFNFGPFFVYYPARFSVVLGSGTLALLVVTVVLGARRKVLSAHGVAFAIAGVLAIALSTTALCTALLLLVRRWLPPNPFVRASEGMAISLAIALVTTVLLYRLSLARRSPCERSLGAAILFTLLGLLATQLLPGTGYLFLWPALGLVTPWAIALARTDKAFDGSALGPRIAAALPALVIVSPYVVQLVVAFGVLSVPLVGAVAALLLTTTLSAWPATPPKVA